MMDTADDRRGTTDPTTSGFNELHPLGTLDSQTPCFKLPLKERMSTLPQRITSSSIVSACAIALLLVVIVLIELHIRAIASHSLPQQRHIGELKSYIGDGPPNRARRQEVSLF